MRCVARHTTLRFDRRVLVNKRSLLVGMTFYAGRISTGGKPSLLQFKTTVRIVTITTLHRSFKHLVVKRQVELMLHFRMATEAKLRFIQLQQTHRCESGFLRVGRRYKNVGARQVLT